MKQAIKESIQKYMRQFGNSDYDEDHFADVVEMAVRRHINEKNFKESWPFKAHIWLLRPVRIIFNVTAIVTMPVWGPFALLLLAISEVAKGEYNDAILGKEWFFKL